MTGSLPLSASRTRPTATPKKRLTPRANESSVLLVNETPTCETCGTATDRVAVYGTPGGSPARYACVAHTAEVRAAALTPDTAGYGERHRPELRNYAGD